jgi:hypothetical protein
MSAPDRLGSSLRLGDRHVVEATVDSSELQLFARDLGGTVTDVLVAAAGRALVVDAPGDAVHGVGLAVGGPAGLVVPVVRNAAFAPLPEVRAAVRRLLTAAHAGATFADEPGAALVLDHIEVRPVGPVRVVEPAGGRVVLLASQPDGADLTLALVADARTVDRPTAERLLRVIVRFVERPYRRLV